MGILCDGAILSGIFLLMILGLLVEATRILAEGKPFAEWAFAGKTLAEMLCNMGLENHGHTLFYVFWYLHMIVIFGFGIYILYSKHLHILAAHPNLFFRSIEPMGALEPITDMEEAETFGASQFTDFTWKQLLDLYACTECGHCNANCPAAISEKPLRPKELIMDLRKHFLRAGKGLLKGNGTDEQPSMIGEVVPEDNLWDCTHCMACMEVCPVGIEHVQKIIDMRRYMVLMESRFLSEVQAAFRGMENNSNPWGLGRGMRADWAKNLGVKTLSEGNDVDILYYVGCAGSFDDHGKKISTAMVKILQTAGINFGLLGTAEGCCGDAARRIGNEYLYQMMVLENIETFNRYGVKKILVSCPHGYNTLKNEYPKFGGDFEVIHHSPSNGASPCQGIRYSCYRMSILYDPI